MNKRALKESVFDTVVATGINFPINYVLIALAFHWELSAFTSAVMFTSVLFSAAVVRKYYIRNWFEKKHESPSI